MQFSLVFQVLPLKMKTKKKGCTSADVFGDELSGTRYAIGDGIRDGNVLGFDPYKCPTFDDLDVKSKVALEMVHAGSIEEVNNDPVKSEKYYELLQTLEMTGHYCDNGKYIKGAEDYLPPSQYEFNPKKGYTAHGFAVVDKILKDYNILSQNKKIP